MKTTVSLIGKVRTGIIISASLLAITFVSSGQDHFYGDSWYSNLKSRLSGTEIGATVILTSDFIGEDYQADNWMGNLKSWALEKVMKHNGFRYDEIAWMKNPVIITTISCPSVELVYEEDYAIEEWMNHPFIEETTETVETWMTRPFNSGTEKNIVIEGWMTQPFDSGIEEYVAIEEWMCTTFNESYEESLAVESWMTAPFEEVIEEPVAVESWMTAPFEESLDETLAVEEWMTKPFNNIIKEEMAYEYLMASSLLWIN